jgi:ubiquinone/menaquinone biosynthesis C-methylase UbiE
MRRRTRTPRKLVARDHQEAYDLWARYFEDPALMANRDAETTRRKLERLAANLPLEESAHILDVGPGDGTLFRIIAPRVARCCGVDPSHHAVKKLSELFEGTSKVEFAVGSADQIPYPDDEFDVVVINSVLLALPARRDIENSLAELVRVCRPGGVVFVGELPFRSELGRGIWVHQARKLWEFGVGAWLRNAYHVYVRPALRREPLVLYPARNLHVPADEFEFMCRRLGVTVECRRHQELRRISTTRNDYILRLEAKCGAPGHFVEEPRS